MAQRKVCTRKVSIVAMGVLLLAGCTTHPAESPDAKLTRQAAEGAQQLHHDVKQAGREAQHALVNARRETKDIVAGAREGWAQGAAKDGPIVRSSVDLNHASLAKLETLPGVHAATARRIVNERPYREAIELENRGILTHAEYKRIELRITAK
jgi:outer membrane murein-binding lipoprotein Lpp